MESMTEGWTLATWLGIATAVFALVLLVRKTPIHINLSQEQQQQQQQQRQEQQEPRRSSLQQRLDEIAQLHKATEAVIGKATRGRGRGWLLPTTIGLLVVGISIWIHGGRNGEQTAREPGTVLVRQPVCTSWPVGHAWDAVGKVASLTRRLQSEAPWAWAKPQASEWLHLEEVQALQEELAEETQAMAAAVQRLQGAQKTSSSSEQITVFGEAVLEAHCRLSKRDRTAATGDKFVRREHCRRHMRLVLNLIRVHLNTIQDDARAVVSHPRRLCHINDKVIELLRPRRKAINGHLESQRAAVADDNWWWCRLPSWLAPDIHRSISRLRQTEALSEFFDTEIQAPTNWLSAHCDTVFASTAAALKAYMELVGTKRGAIANHVRFAVDIDAAAEASELLRDAFRLLLEATLQPHGSCL